MLVAKSEWRGTVYEAVYKDILMEVRRDVEGQWWVNLIDASYSKQRWMAPIYNRVGCDRFKTRNEAMMRAKKLARRFIKRRA